MARQRPRAGKRPRARGDPHDRHRDHRRRANARDDHAESEGELDLGEELSVGHAEAAPGVADGVIDAHDPGEGVADDGEQRIEKERPGNYVLAWLNLLFVCECVDFARDAYARKAGTGGRCDSTTGEGGCARESVDIMLWHTV